jgi:hypothetical protein
MGFDYTTLVNSVRRLINDLPENEIEINESSDNASYYIQLAADGYVTPVSSGVIINGVPLSDDAYIVSKNVIRADALIPAGSEVFVQYDWVTNTDEEVLGMIDDSIHYLVETCFNIDFGFGDSTAVPSGVADPNTWTDQDIEVAYRSLFVHGAALNILGVALTEAGDDAIYIKDGDTVIDTAASSREKARGYQPIVDRWNELKQCVMNGNFEGVVMY